MAQLNDLLVAGAARLLNGLGILGTTNSDSILPNKTDTYVLGESGKRWNSAHIKTITGSHITFDTLTVNNYATIGGGQAATAKNTGALRVKGGISTEQQSFFSGGAIFSGAADSSTRLYVFGDKTAQHISMGDAGIQAYSNNTPTPSKLYLQYNGGDLDIGKSGHTGVTTIYGPLNYAGFSAASDNADRVVWFSYNGTIGRPVYDNDFKYNPSTNRLTLGRLYLTNTEGVTHIQFSRANYNYVIAPTGGSIAFGANGATGGSQVSLVISASDVIPGQNNGTIELGSPDYAWKSLYTRNVYWDDGNGKQNAYTSYTNGTASTTEGTAGAQGYFNLFLGNSTAVSTTAGSGAGNSRGRLYIYGTGAYSSLIQTQAASSSKTVTIPNYTGYMIIGNDGYNNPTEATTYYMPFYFTTHKRLSANDGFRYRTLEGTADALGYGGLYLGNSVASGTAKNKYGFIRIYAKNADYTTILSQGNGDRNFYLPNYAGDMYSVHAGNNDAVGAGDKPVYIAANGRATVCGTSLAVSITGNAATTTKLKTARTIRTNLASTSTASFDGSANITPGVTGTLGIGNGGTGATNALTAFYNLNYRGAATNCNNNISIGNYYWATDCTNVPVTSSYGLLYNFVSTGESHNNSSNWIWQLAFPTSAIDMYLRSKINDGAWGGWQKILHTGNYTSTLDDRYYTKSEIQSRGLMLNLSLNINNTTAFYNMMKSQQFTVFTNWWTGSSYFPSIYTSGIMFPHLDSRYRSMIVGNCSSHNLYYGYYYSENINSDTTSVPKWTRIWLQGNSVTGAVWNDYAECRESDTEDLGYVLMETGKDSLTKTTERLSHFAGVSSDTWGFSQGETEKAKTPIAVAGRVLVYPYQDRNNYKPGDCVCAAPGGTVDIMTREEVILWPDRIVGTVSQVPDYDEWGGGEMSDRDSVKVNGRIWIKVR